jgi:uncharacterized Tic20 family protein
VIPIGCRTRAACCHLAVFTVLGTFLIPFAMRYVEEPDQEFANGHRRGALFYQFFGTLAFGVGSMISNLLGDFRSDFVAGAALTFFWIAFICALGIYLLGAFVLAVQAWSGDSFQFSWLNRWVYVDRSSA